MPKFDPFKILCGLFIWLLRPLSVPLEMFCHKDVGERYPGFASIAALLATEIWCLFSDDTFALHALIVAFIARLITHRVVAIRHRIEGGTFVYSRSPGRPLIMSVIPQIPEQLLYWLEPLVLILASAVICVLSPSLGSYLLCGSTAWLMINILRTLDAYNRVLDQYDADPQSATAAMAGRYFEVIPAKAAIEGGKCTEPLQNAPQPLPTSLAVLSQ